MNRIEQKDRVRDIVEAINVTINECRRKKAEFDAILLKFDELSESINDINDVLGVDIESTKDEFTDEFFTEMLEEPHDMLYRFNDDINYAISELSEKRAEALDEKYAGLDELIEKLTQEYSEYGDIDELISNLEDVKYGLKFMSK